MKVLYVTSNLYSKDAKSASIRNITIINNLIKLNYQVDVLTLKKKKEEEDAFLKKELKCVIQYKETLDTSNLIFRLFLRLEVLSQSQKLKKLSFFFKIVKHIIQVFYFFPDKEIEWAKIKHRNINFNKYNVIISSTGSITSHYVALKIKKQNKKLKWIQIWGDPWFKANVTKYFFKLRSFYSEKKLLKEADKVIYVSKPTLDIMKSYLPNLSDKFKYIPRAYFKEIVSPKKEINKYTLSYTGIISSAYGRNIEELLSALENYNEKNSFKIELNIYGFCDNEIQNKIKTKKFVNYFGDQEYKEILKIYSKTDGLLFLSNNEGSNQIPGKLFDYFGTNKSILAIVENEIDMVSKFIKSTERTILSKNTFIEIEKKLLELVNDKKRIPLKEYSGEMIAKKIIKEIIN